MPEPFRPTPRSRPATLLVCSPSTAMATAWAVLALEDGAPPMVGLILLTGGGAPSSVDLPIPVLGSVDDVRRLHEGMRFSRALMCAAPGDAEAAGRARDLLESLGVVVDDLPSVQSVLDGSPGGRPREDRGPEAGLLGRPARELDPRPARELIEGKRVLVTGAGGSIGSELARCCASHGPAVLGLMDRSENALFEIDRQLGEQHPEVVRHAMLHDVVDSASTRRLVRELRPDVVFHAAAHKHVPMMEDHPAAALTNNLFGTRSIALAALEAGVGRFVMISTDKAVRPRSVMGASKWLAEQFVRSLASRGSTRFSVVRFGNVIGSACSVLPIWSAQLEQGRAITVTDPHMTRYFMTIPEAAALVIQSAALAQSVDQAPVRVLDMGAPVEIGALAERFVRSRGFEPRWEGEGMALSATRSPKETLIRITGIRPGEKLHEDLAHDPISLRETVVEGVLEWSGRAPDRAWVDEMLISLDEAQSIDDPEVVIDRIGGFVPEISAQNPNNQEVVSAA